MIYLLEAEGETLKRAGESGVESSHRAAPDSVKLSDESVWPFQRVIENGETVLVQDLPERIAEIPKGEWNDPPTSAILLPIVHQGQARPAGVFVAGINPYRRFDHEFRGFLSLLVNQIAVAIGNATAYETERRRAEALAELDRAKTLFFSNVSHEFRTPLTLMLGPLEELLANARHRLSTQEQQQAEVARRNALRLLKLVNTLLDFSRIEAGRMQAAYEPTDLAGVTAEIASVFRSAMEKAGLKFSVACEPISEPIYVDREMWEKIVLNLVSNAFKFTFEGEVRISLKDQERAVELAVSDTGVGIPAHELTRVFERFHRVENTRARTHEGTGIGLALVQELARLHQGTVRVTSIVGEGTTFTISIPKGKAHLPQDRIEAKHSAASLAVPRETYVEETQGWLPQRLTSASEPATKPRELIVLADDNADMREYVRRLLSEEYEVHAVSDGVEAMEAIRRLHPSVVIADIMMPQLDGFGVLQAIRSDPAVSTTPVILLSARAGEEARVEGFQAGADDYLVKPFTARELLTRVGTHVKMAILRRKVSEREGVQQRINRVLAECADLSEAALQVLQVVGDVLDWTVGGLWVVDQQAAQIAQS